MATSECMIGRIEHRLDLSHHSSDFTRKRRRKQRTASISDDNETVQNFRMMDAGIYFVEEGSAESPRRDHLLIVPVSLDKKVCDAIRFQLKVRIIAPWTSMELLTSPISSTTNDVRSSQEECFVLEAQNLDIVDEKCLLPDWETTNAINLTNWREQEHDESFNSTSAKSTIIAKVDAISPIIAAIPQDPFCLMELYDDSDDEHNDVTCSVLVVVKGAAALACHAGIQPGDIIQIAHSKIKRQRWMVPEALSKNYPQLHVPPRVLVMSDPLAVLWNQSAALDENNGVSIAPTVPINLSIVEGTISRVVETPTGFLQSIELTGGRGGGGHDDDSCDNGRAVVLVSHFPMSTNLQYGLRPGAFVRAINVHFVASYGKPSLSSKRRTCQYYGACLRSTICLLHPASIPHRDISDSSMFEGATSVMTALYRKEGAIPWKYGRVQNSLLYQALVCHVKDSHEHVQQIAKHFKSLSTAALVTGLLTIYRGQSLLHTGAVQTDAVAAASKRRDQFAEFLDHCVVTENGVKPTAPAPHKGGCHMSNIEPMLLPTIVTMSQVKRTVLGVLEYRLKHWTSKMSANNKIQSGSVASIQLNSCEMVNAITGSEDAATEESNSLLCIVGSISAIGKSGEPFLLEDATCCCPITIKEPYSIPEGCDHQHIVGSTNICLGSAFCLGLMPSSVGGTNNPGSVTSSSSLINLESWTRHSQLSKQGSCAVLDCHGYIFLVSIHVHFQSIAASDEKITLQTGQKEPMIATVGQMLDPKYRIEREGRFAGILHRQRLRFTKIKSGRFDGMRLTLAHCSTPEKSEVNIANISSRQSLELNIATRIPDHNKVALVKCIQRLSAQSTGSLLSEQLNLAAAWWKMADGVSSALSACGLDEILTTETDLNQSAASRFVPSVVVPVSARSQGANGFVRFNCDLEDVTVSLVEINNLALPPSDISSAALHSLGSQRHLPGMLDRLPMGRYICYGEDSDDTPLSSGIQCVTLGGLHKAICADIQNCSQQRLAPSMVQLVRAARFLTVAYCKVQVECARCYKPLIRRSKKGAALSGVVDSTQVDPQTHFWDIPILLDGGIAPQKVRTRRRFLRCPNHCPDSCSEVKWECSGILDDGTGQGKLYSERDLALKLLGIDADTVDIIEDGAWELEGGIYYQKAMPPSAFLKQAVREARLVVTQQTKGRKEARAEDVLRVLSPSARASYLLHQECINSPNSTRDMNYFIRCKPLSTAAFHLNRTEVEMTTSEALPVNTAVYSLPPLKLNLVDITFMG